MSQTFLSGLVIITVQVLSYFGVQVGGEALTTTITTLLTIGSAIWVLIRRYQNGGINKIGKRV